ncbi:MAG TPA: sugar phosphate isomerase/epimerase [Firmicutes bacterium]|nr:sugar phosphate isomerase/epimerase [Bacillota bacterium]
MIRLTGFADEISKDLTEQLDVLESESMRFLELRGVWGKNVSTFTDDEVSQIRDTLQARNVGVSCIGSPIGKIGINDPFEPHLELLGRVLDIAEALDTKYVRIFSFYIPKGEDPAKYRNEVMARMRRMVELAASRDFVLLHENESGIYGDVAARCADILSTINSPHLRAIFDPANFVQAGQRPFAECWDLIQPYLEYMHIKDAVMETRKVVPAGEGDGNLKEIVGRLKEMNFSGFTSLEPHLSVAGRMSGFSGPELFKTAVRAFKKLLDDAGIAWS